MLRRITPFLTGIAAAAPLLWSTAAWAPFHNVVIEQIFFGTQDCPNAQYVMLRTLTAGQVFVNGQHLPAENADGSAAAEFGSFDHNLNNGASGVGMLIGTADAQGLFGIRMDQVVQGRLVSPDGRVCFGLFGGQPVDCVAYGNFTGDNGVFGSPAAAPALGLALVRQSNTRNNSADFSAATPAPENNDGQGGTLGTCGGVLPTPTVTPTRGPAPACVGDCDDNGVVGINELIVGVNIALGNATVAQCAAIDANSDGTISINELIAAVSSLLNGCAG